MKRLAVPLGLLGAVAVLLRAGGAELAAPPLEPGGWAGWAEARGTIAAALALVRVAALGVALLWCAATAVAAAGHAVGAVRLAGTAERVLPAAVRRSLAGAGLASAVAAVSPAAAMAEPPEPPRLVLLPAEDGTARMTVLDDEAPTPASAAPPAAETWVVQPGDSFWSIAEEVVADALGRPATDAEVVPYWRALIDANRDRLVTPNPDVVRPGQSFVLPPVTAGA